MWAFDTRPKEDKMLDILKARKEALEERGNKGFTLAELLIVVAIIAVLVAISIPVFTGQLEKSREAVDASNLRAAYAVGQAEALSEQPAAATSKWYSPSAGTLVDAKVVCGKGTSTTTNTNFDLPAVCTYTTGTDVTTMGIKVTYDKNGVTACEFAAS